MLQQHHDTDESDREEFLEVRSVSVVNVVVKEVVKLLPATDYCYPKTTRTSRAGKRSFFKSGQFRPFTTVFTSFLHITTDESEGRSLFKSGQFDTCLCLSASLL